MLRSNGEPETRRDKATARRRNKILEAAVMCFLENGYHQTGVRDIAKRAGVSLGNLYNHFPGKHDVLVEIAMLERTELEPILKILAGDGKAAAILDRFITAYAKHLAAPENIILTIEIASEAIRKPDIGDLFLANRKELTEALAQVIERGVTEGEFRSLSDPKETSELIVELIDGSAYRSVLTDMAMRRIVGGVRDFIFAALQKR